jgi:hypothetical protein
MEIFMDKKGRIQWVKMRVRRRQQALLLRLGQSLLECLRGFKDNESCESPAIKGTFGL